MNKSYIDNMPPKKISTLILIFLLLLLTASYFGSSFEKSSQLDLFFLQTDSFMKKWVKNGKIDYKRLKENPEEMDSLLKTIEKISLEKALEEEKKAFYINSYNLLVISQIVKFFPLRSALDKNGFFDKFRHTVAGERLTLDELEKGRLIDIYKDSRIHFAIACGAASCPKLASYAYVPDCLEAQLYKKTVISLKDEEILSINESGKMIQVSKIFEWYKEDFKDDEGSMMGFIEKYRPGVYIHDLDIDYMEYDWKLNSLTE